MKSNRSDEQILLNAKNQVRRIKIFYLHLVLYIIVVALIVLNFYVMEGPYTSIITGLNITVLVFWTALISIHGWSVFKGRFLFKKSWEDRKTEKFIEAEKVETSIWE